MGYKFNIVNNWLGGTTIIRNYKNGDGGFELVTPYNIKTFDTLESVFNFKQFRYKVAEPLHYPIYLKFTYKNKSYDIFKFTDEFTSEHKFASKSFKNLDGSIYKWIHKDYCEIISSYDYYELFNKRVGNILLHDIPSAEPLPIFKNIQEIYGQSICTNYKIFNLLAILYNKIMLIQIEVTHMGNGISQINKIKGFLVVEPDDMTWLQKYNVLLQRR